jgi:outer membrane PBP1 activator LpoA protein
MSRVFTAPALLLALLLASTGLVQAQEPLNLDAELAQRAEAQFVLGDVAGALATHAILETSLTGPARADARDRLWRALNALPPDADFAGVTEPVARGWVELMQLTRAGAPLEAFEDWRRRHGAHPGESQIAAGLATPATVYNGAPRYALLLPLSGPLLAASKAIQAGAAAARNRAGAGAPDVLVLDTANGIEPAAAAAVSQGFSTVIGPLRKEEVAALSRQPLTARAITLNYPDAVLTLPAGLTPFGLAPEDEARAAADHAAGRSLLRAVILAQEGDWGARAAAAFRRHFEGRGGVVLDAETFRPGSVDYTRQLKRLLGISYSEERGAKVAATGVKAELLPAPRGDIDVVFLAARSAQAKLIWPQMRYLRAGRIATYAPAAAADGGNSDLGRLHVCDAPWRLSTQGAIAALRGELAAVNPRAADLQRLFALGYDAYELARRLGAQALVPGEAVEGLSGTLVLEPDGAVRRRLDCVALYSSRDAALERAAEEAAEEP